MTTRQTNSNPVRPEVAAAAYTDIASRARNASTIRSQIARIAALESIGQECFILWSGLSPDLGLINALDEHIRNGRWANVMDLCSEKQATGLEILCQIAVYIGDATCEMAENATASVPAN